MKVPDDISLADRTQITLSDPTRTLMKGLTGFVSPYVGEFARARAALRNANRFTLSNGFLDEAVEAASTTPDVIIRRSLLAHLPYDNVWIELDTNHRIDLQWRLGTLAAPRSDDLGRTGYLLRRVGGRPDEWESTEFNHAAAASDEKYSEYVGLGLVTQALGPWREFKNGQAKRVDKFISSGWGYTESVGDYDRWMNALCGIGRSTYGNVLFKSYIGDMIKKDTPQAAKYASNMIDAVKYAAGEYAGDLRFLVTVLAMINVVPIEYHYRRPQGRKFTHRLKTMDYLDDSSITIRPGRKRVVNILREAANQEHSRRRRHEVRGHFRVYHKGTPNEEAVWIEKHMRGDASLGFVTHHYEVKE